VALHAVVYQYGNSALLAARETTACSGFIAFSYTFYAQNRDSKLIAYLLIFFLFFEYDQLGHLMVSVASDFIPYGRLMPHS
jgi:hypothetical protein